MGGVTVLTTRNDEACFQRFSNQSAEQEICIS
jgi:hypothetical protein